MCARQAWFGLLVVTLCNWPSIEEAHAEPARKVKHVTSGHAMRTAPDVTGTIAKPALPAVSPPPASSSEAEIPPPFKLPNASRARMHACGATWRDMKFDGTTGDDDWRDFALKCLAGKGPTLSN